MSILANDAAGECFKYAMLVLPSLCFLTDYAKSHSPVGPSAVDLRLSVARELVASSLANCLAS